MKYKSLLVISILFCSSIFFSHPLPTFAQRGTDGPYTSTQTSDRIVQETTIRGGIATLYGFDPIARTLCLTDGKDGSIYQAGEVRNRCSHIDFDNYEKDSFTVGIQGSERGVIIDLGTAIDLQQEYDYEETVGKPNGFTSIRVKDEKVVILRNSKDKTLQELKEAGALFQTQTPKDTSTKSSATIKAGHIYLARIMDWSDASFQILVKIIVLSHSPSEFVTFRWERL